MNLSVPCFLMAILLLAQEPDLVSALHCVDTLRAARVPQVSWIILTVKLLITWFIVFSYLKNCLGKALLLLWWNLCREGLQFVFIWLGGTCFGCSPSLWPPYFITHQHNEEFYDCLLCHLGFALLFCIAFLEQSKLGFGSVTILWTQSRNPRGKSNSLCCGGHPTRCLKLPRAATNPPQK